MGNGQWGGLLETANSEKLGDVGLGSVEPNGVGASGVSLGTASPPPRVAQRVAEEAVLVQVVARLREIERSTGLERTLAIGELILNQFFGGDAHVWRDRRRNKNNSIRRLAERPDCPYGKSALNEAIGIFVSVRNLPCVRTFGHVSSSHVAAVLRLPSVEQEPMLRRAESQRWSVRELKREVVLANRNVGERRGRPSLGQADRALALLAGRIRELEVAISAALECADVLDGERLGEVLTKLREQVERLSQLCLEKSGPGSDVRTVAGVSRHGGDS